MNSVYGFKVSLEDHINKRINRIKDELVSFSDEEVTLKNRCRIEAYRFVLREIDSIFTEEERGN